MRKKGKKVIRPAGDELMDYLNRGFAICNRCGAVMDRREDPRGGCDIYACPSCGSVYNHCTLFLVGERGLAVIQQRYDPETKHTFWAEVDEWLTDPLYLHPRFRAFFDRRAGTGTDGLYPTVTIRQIMWALKMKPLPKQPWETVFDHTPI